MQVKLYSTRPAPWSRSGKEGFREVNAIRCQLLAVLFVAHDFNNLLTVQELLRGVRRVLGERAVV
jgi:hypothetical protein